MKNFVVKAFQQKYHLPSKVKEKSATYLKNVHEIGKHLPRLKMMKKTNTLKQNQRLSSAQKVFISFLYNFIWKRISSSFVDIITPSIIKPNQLTMVTDYRHHIGFCQGTELLLKTIGETGLKSNNSSVRDMLVKKNNLECDQEKNIASTIEHATVFSSLAVPGLKTNESISNHTQRKNNGQECNLFVRNDILKSAKGILDKERSKIVKPEKTSKIKGKKVRSINNYSRKTRNSLQKGSKSKQCTETSSPINTLPTKPNNNKKPNKRKSSMSEQIQNKAMNDKSIFKDVSLKAGSSIPSRGSVNNELYVGLNQNGLRNDVQASLLDQTEVLKNVSKIDSKCDSLQKSGYSLIEEDKNSVDINNDNNEFLIDEKTGSRILTLNESYDKIMAKTNQGPKKDSNLPNMLNKTPSSSNKCVKTNKTIPSKSYKKEKRKASMEKKLKKLSLLTQATMDIQVNNKKDIIRINEVHGSSFEEHEQQFTKSPLTETCKSKSDKKIELFNKENRTLINCDKANEDHIGDTIKTPEIVKTNLVVFDTSQDEAQIVVQEQTKSNLVDLKTVITKENSHKTSQREKKAKQLINSYDEHKDMKRVERSQKGVKPATITPWKRNKDKSAATRNRTKSKNTNSSNNFDSVTSTYSQKYENNLERKKIDVAEHVSSNTSFSTISNLPSDKTNKKNLTKALSLSSVQMKNKQECLSPKKTTSNMELSSLKVSLPTKNQKPQMKGNSLKHQIRDEQQILNTGNKNYSIEEQTEPTSKLNKEPLLGSKPTTVYYGQKTGSASDNELNKKKRSIKQNLDTVITEIKINPKENSKIPMNSEYHNALSRAVANKSADTPLKENTNTDIISSSKITQTPPLTKAKKENKLEKQTQLQSIRASVAPYKPKMSNLGKNVPAKPSNNELKPLRDAHLSVKNKTKDINTLKNTVSLNSSGSLKSTNKTNLEYNDRILSKTVADISQGLDKLSGKEEFKLKMNHLLNNLTVTGQIQQAYNIQRKIKSQEALSTKLEKDTKSLKTLAQEPDIKDKSTYNQELNIKLKNHEPLNKASNLAPNKISTLKTNVVPGNGSVKENVVIGKPSTKPPLTVSVRPRLSVPKDTKPHKNITRIGERNVQEQAVAKIRSSTSSSSNDNTGTNSKSEPTNAVTASQGEVKQQIPVNSNLKNKEGGKKAVKSTIRANNASHSQKLKC